MKALLPGNLICLAKQKICCTPIYTAPIRISVYSMNRKYRVQEAAKFIILQGQTMLINNRHDRG